jgi:hypothetical protein
LSLTEVLRFLKTFEILSGDAPIREALERI